MKPPSKDPKTTGVEVYSIQWMSQEQCEFIAPHSVETLLSSNGPGDTRVLYFAPSKCLCVHCLMSDARALANDVSTGTACLS